MGWGTMRMRDRVRMRVRIIGSLMVAVKIRRSINIGVADRFRGFIRVRVMAIGGGDLFPHTHACKPELSGMRYVVGVMVMHASQSCQACGSMREGGTWSRVSES